MHFDLLIRHGEVIDGEGRARYRADVGVRRGRVAQLGDLAPAHADREIDARGLVVAPGFIDCHTHDDLAVLTEPLMPFKTSQGVTTVVTGNCGISLAPQPRALPPPLPAPLDLLDASATGRRHATFGAWLQALDEAPPALNVAPLVGHTTLRAMAMRDVGRRADAGEIAKMQRLASEAADAGAIGGSSGLYYEGARAADASEVIEAFRPLGGRGVYCAHMRDETTEILSAMDETFRIGEELGMTTVVSHHKVAGVANHGRSVQTLAHLRDAMRRQRICLDCYPYAASSTVLTADRTRGATRTLIASSRPHPECAGRDLAQVAGEWGCSIDEACERLSPGSAIYFAMNEADVQRILAFEPTMIGSDGIPLGDKPHPRLWGTFPRVLGHYARDLALFPLETAVHKMTGLTARNFGLADRGVVREGAHADLAIFDAADVLDVADFDHPTRPSRGIVEVIVGGRSVWRDGAPTGERPGRVLRHGR